jgi:tetratricopeptide (TPR) repeat protein
VPLDALFQRARFAIGQGDRLQAESLLRALLQRAPDDPQAHELAAMHWAKAGARELSLKHLVCAEGQPDLAAAQLCSLARIAHGWGELERAAALLERAVAVAPDDPQGWWLLAYTYAGSERWSAALDAMQRAHVLDPDNPAVLEKLVDLEFDHGVPRQAMPVVERWAQRHPYQLDAQLKLGVMLGRLGQHAQAVQHYRQAIDRLPEAPDLWMALGQSLEYLGDSAASADAYRRALMLRADWALPLSGLLGLTRRNPDPDLVARAQRMLATTTLPDAERATLGYELGKCLDAARQPAGAMAAWKAANAARQGQIGVFDPSIVRELVDRTEQVFSRGIAPEEAAAGDGSGVVLIVGMPRSGTTLVEQIIHAHPHAHGAGELLDLTLMANRIDRDGLRWPEVCETPLPAAIREELRSDYLQSLRAHANPVARCFVDKAPLNFFFLGLAAELFPDLKVIWCRRDPRDVAVSIHAENFSLDAPFATSWEGIAEYMTAEARLMALWQKVLPVPMFELRYQTLVENPEEKARELMHFLGLEWNPACLEFHASSAAVQTPSRWQVRQPVNRNGLGRWKTYADALQPFLERAQALGLKLDI